MIYQVNEEIDSIYFLYEGAAGFILNYKEK